MMEFPPPPQGDGRATQGNSLKETQWRVGPELRLLNLHFFNICRHHPTLKFKPHATDDERYVSGIDGVPLRCRFLKSGQQQRQRLYPQRQSAANTGATIKQGSSYKEGGAVNPYTLAGLLTDASWGSV